MLPIPHRVELYHDCIASSRGTSNEGNATGSPTGSSVRAECGDKGHTGCPPRSMAVWTSSLEPLCGFQLQGGARAAWRDSLTKCRPILSQRHKDCAFHREKTLFDFRVY